jgi:hypothetical protein
VLLVFWIREYASPKAHRQTPTGVGQPDPRDGSNPRWAHTCAWDGHELGDMDYLQHSPHERVCRFHYPQFQSWIEDLSKTKYRFEHVEEA